MSLLVLALVGVLLPSALDVRVEEARGLSDADRAVLVEQVRSRASRHEAAQGTLVVRALALPGVIRVTLSLSDVSPPVVARADLSGEPATWSAAIDVALEALGLRAPPPPPPPSPAASPPPVDQPLSFSVEASQGAPVLGLSLLAGGVAAGAVGIVLGVMNASARDEGNPLPTGPDRDRLDDRARATGLGANILFGVAGGALLAGAWVLLAD